ncbi:unnamed protein product [Boreogadus saida]
MPLDVSGFVRLQLRRGTKQTAEKVYVVKNLRTPLLRRPAIMALGLLIRVDSIEMENIKACYPKLCSGLAPEHFQRMMAEKDGQHMRNRNLD